ncbi:RelA/SpoT domain-containing protein [Acinetobacter bereziniae]|jgi:ppGpp synthetase/RelA/SpoT-type nucleotidyltranferase|uniref:RelA/SpoT domain-containing protein n=1 Tax=Acinetobacter bereziniae TaxID=106648 RepID=UPI00073F48B9|nr:RelA/SpoT domain-containing protein [Acinetobacter bereziniae]RSZ23740.1 (p)ppGpp synthetase [Acinetobacter bereziniae]
MTDQYKIQVPGTNVLRRAGATLIDSNATEDDVRDAYVVIDQWRSLHSYPIDTFQKTLKRRCGQLGFKDFTVAQRLKRMPSIMSKLIRNPKMNLARMQDVGGLRIILPTVQDVYILHNDLIVINRRFSHIPKLPCNDYIKNPKADGYRSLHQVFTYKSRDHEELDGLSIELQIRTNLQHTWATAVETLGVIENTSIKSGYGSDDIKLFLKLSSALFSIKEEMPVIEELTDLSPRDIAYQAKELELKLQIFSKLKGFAISTSQIETTSRSQYAYHLLILEKIDGNWKVHVMPFSKSQEDKAKSFYALMEAKTRNDINSDVVLVSVGDMKAIKKAYPNYFLDTNQFIKEMETAFKKYLN